MYGKNKILPPSLFLSDLRLIQAIITGIPGWKLVQQNRIEIDPLTPEEIEASIHEGVIAIP